MLSACDCEVRMWCRWDGGERKRRKTLSAKSFHKLVLFGDGLHGPSPVSYTHLDVYKRQVIDEASVVHDLVKVTAHQALADLRSRREPGGP